MSNHPMNQTRMNFGIEVALDSLNYFSHLVFLDQIMYIIGAYSTLSRNQDVFDGLAYSHSP
jgi:hypothetical protein